MERKLCVDDDDSVMSLMTKKQKDGCDLPYHVTMTDGSTVAVQPSNQPAQFFDRDDLCPDNLLPIRYE
jgi:hypothetical protein